MSVQVLGQDLLRQECDRLARDLAEAEDPAAMAAAEPIRGAWRSLVPVRDGHYRDALTITWLKSVRKAGVGTGWDAGLPRDKQPFVYSKVLEFGDSDTPAQPSARPALKQARPAALEAGAVPLKARVKGRRPRRKP